MASDASSAGRSPLGDAGSRAWLLQRLPNILLIPGTSSSEHLRENVADAGLELPEDAVAELNTISA